jgi:NADPH-dependent curcumin reductase CurA
MSEAKNRQFLIAARPQGLVKESDFRYVETPVPEPGEGQVLVRQEIVAVEPALRGQMENRANYAAPLQIGDVMRALGVGTVVRSNNPDFPVGQRVQGLFGFQDYAVADGKGMISRVPDGVPGEAALYVFGGTGYTAYYGMAEVGHPKLGDAVLVSGAAGAVGSLAGQIARILGAGTVVGIAGSDEKCRWLTGDLGFDAAINYKTDDVAGRVKELFPKGIDVYYDNVGGEILDIALANLAMGARVVLCGGISRYNKSGPIEGPKNYFNLVYSRATMTGFIIVDHVHRYKEWAAVMGQWIAEGKLKYRVDMLEGFENLPRGLIRLFTGDNIGKQLIRIA